MNLQDHIVQIARSQLGVREVGGNNEGPEIVMYQEATWLKPGAWPWCAAFCAWVLRKAIINSGTQKLKHCPDASARGWETWAQKNGWQLLSSKDVPEPGDFVTFDFKQDGSSDHIGIVVGVNPDGAIETIEGNTNGKGERDSESGDGVWRKTRKRSTITNFIRIPANA